MGGTGFTYYEKALTTRRSTTRLNGEIRMDLENFVQGNRFPDFLKPIRIVRCQVGAIILEEDEEEDDLNDVGDINLNA